MERARSLLLLALASTTACARASVGPLDLCPFEPVRTVAPDEPGTVGLTPAETVAWVDGLSMEALFEPNHSNDAGLPTFAARVTLHAAPDGAAFEEELLPEAIGASTGECPEGPVLKVPVQLEMHLDAGDRASMAAGEAFVTTWPDAIPYAATPTPGLRFDPPPAWLQRIANEYGCADPGDDMTPRVHVGREARPSAELPEPRPAGSIDAIGRGSEYACGVALLAWGPLKH